ncbi:glycosyltransferase [Microbulbifer sp. SSSA008]|uniref:glycosyltransferase n=1 Tax=Microbulbifer sp. SSSA008 TaxID=3243380 RepID=UPI00403A1C74
MKLPRKNSRILFVTMQYGAGYKQGTEKYIKNLTSELKPRGYEIFIAAGNPEHIKQKQDEQCKGFIGIPTNGWCSLLGADVNFYVKWLTELQPDIVHMANPAHIGVNILKAAETLNIPYFVSITDFWWLCPKHTLTLPNGTFCKGFETSSICRKCITKTHPKKVVREVASLKYTNVIAQGLIYANNIYQKQATPSWSSRNETLRDILCSAKKIICLSKTGQEKLESFFSLSNTCYIPAGLSNHWFKERPGRKEVGSNPKVTIGFLGALAPHKGLHTLIEALEQLKSPNVSLKVAGKIHDHQYFNKISNFELNIDYIGEVTEAQAVSFIDSIDILVIPSTSPENQPQVLLEAAARGKIVIASASPGCAELLEDNVIFPIENAYELRKILQCYLDAPQKFSPPSPPLSAKDVANEIIRIYDSI